MNSIMIIFRDGTKREFPHVGRAGGSYTKHVTYAGGFVIIEDEWGKKTAFPADVVQEVIQEAPRGW